MELEQTQAEFAARAAALKSAPLPEKIDALFDLTYVVGDTQLGKLLERTLSELEPPRQHWGSEGQRKEVVSERTEGKSRLAAYERPRSWHYDDYRPVAGVMVPFWVYAEEPIFNREYIFETIDANPAGMKYVIQCGG